MYKRVGDNAQSTHSSHCCYYKRGILNKLSLLESIKLFDRNDKTRVFQLKIMTKQKVQAIN